VDVLLLGDEEHFSERMRLPHSEVLNRRFVLVPLLELDPGLKTPGRESLAAALALLPDTGEDAVVLAGPPLQTATV
jgi:7,8-dihydro-6-hydroxymethylpterin-pyrophosphokinase